MSDGTGIVHIAPAFGEDDAKVGRKYDLPFVQFVDGKGELTEETPSTGFLKQSVRDVSVHGLKMFRTGVFQETDIGVRRSISGSVKTAEK